MGKKITRRARRWLILLLALVCWALVHLIYVVVDGLHAYKGKADIAIVLGNRVEADGTLSPWLKGRVDRALRLYQEGQVPRIMVSGGRGKEGGHYPEGLAMKQYLVAHGVPADRIIEDNDGENTYLTAKDFLSVADSLKAGSAIVVSSFYHITRAKYIIRKLGFRNVHSVSSDTFFRDDIIATPRDCIAFYKYVFAY